MSNFERGKRTNAYLAVDARVLAHRHTMVWCAQAVFVGIALAGLFTFTLGHEVPVTLTCSDHCQDPAKCDEFTAQCVPTTDFGVITYCATGYTTETCTKACACGSPTIACTIEEECAVCAAGYTRTAAGVCTACATGFETLDEGDYATCTYCATGYGYLIGPPVTCTACTGSDVTDDGPHHTICALA